MLIPIELPVTFWQDEDGESTPWGSLDEETQQQVRPKEDLLCTFFINHIAFINPTKNPRTGVDETVIRFAAKPWPPQCQSCVCPLPYDEVKKMIEATIYQTRHEVNWT